MHSLNLFISSGISSLSKHENAILMCSSNINAHDFRLKFLNEYKYGVYSMDDDHIRIAFSCLDKELIPELIKKFKQCIKQF